MEIREYLRDAAGSRSLVFDLSITHDRFGSSTHVQQNGALSHPQDLDAPLRLAAQRKINSYRQHYADNQNISFLLAIMTTSSRMHGEFLRLLFLQAHRETTAHFLATGLPSQQNRSDNAFRFKRAAFYMKTLFPYAELNLLSPGSGCPLQAGTGHGRPGRAPGRC